MYNNAADIRVVNGEQDRYDNDKSPDFDIFNQDDCWVDFVTAPIGYHIADADFFTTHVVYSGSHCLHLLCITPV